MTEKEKMLSGILYDAYDEELMQLRQNCRTLQDKLQKIDANDNIAREEIYDQLLGSYGKGVYILNASFDYGKNTSIGDDFSSNFNLVVLDCATVHIGNRVLIGPNCTIATPIHPLLSEERSIRTNQDGTRSLFEYAKPIVIEDDVWIASNVVIQGGVTIGQGAVIAAGSVVTKDIPAGALAMGIPCRVVRMLTEDDKLMGSSLDPTGVLE